MSTNRRTVGKWLRRYNQYGEESIIKDAPRRGRIPIITEAKEKQIVNTTPYTQGVLKILTGIGAAGLSKFSPAYNFSAGVKFGI